MFFPSKTPEEYNLFFPLSSEFRLSCLRLFMSLNVPSDIGIFEGRTVNNTANSRAMRFPSGKSKYFSKSIKRHNYLMYKLFYRIYESKKWQNSLGLDNCFEDLANPIDLFKTVFKKARKVKLMTRMQ